MDLAFAAEQYAQAQAVAAAAAQYYANAANAAAMNAAAMNAAVAEQQGQQGIQGFGMMPQLAGTTILGPQFIMQQAANPFGHHIEHQLQQHQLQQHQQQQQQIANQKPPSPPKIYDRDDSSDDGSPRRDRGRRNRSPRRSPDSNMSQLVSRWDRDSREGRDRRHRDSGGRARSRSSERRNRRRDRSPRESSSRRDRDRERERDRGRDRTPDSGDDDGKNVPPNSTIMVRGLAQHISENDIRADILSYGLQAKDIRLIRKKETGASRGFAFVEFVELEDAKTWMDAKQGVLMFKDQFRAIMQYSLPREGRPGDLPRILHDWICLKCGVQNFRRRDQCFKCGGPKTESEMEEGSEEVSPNPTNTVLLRGLDALSTEDSVLGCLMRITSLPIKGIRIGRDPLTNMSRGICYVEMNTVVDAMFLHNQLLGEPPTIDDKLISVSYYRMPLTAGQTGAAGGVPMAANALAAAQWNCQGQQKSNEEIERLAEYSASMYAKTVEEKAYYLEYYRNYYRNGGTSQNATGPKQAAGDSTVTVNGVEYKRYPTPDVSSYVYDESSGYYYDAQTTFYYDVNSTYYYNSKTNSYFYWSQEHHTYLPSEEAGSGANNQEDGGDKKKDDKKDKVKTAKKIAKDMEKWAKTLNQRKEAAKVNQPATAAPAPSAGASRGGGLEDLAFSMFTKQVTPSGASKQISAPKAPEAAVAGPSASGLAGLASYGSDSDNDDQGPTGPSSDGTGDAIGSSAGVTDETKLSDWSKLACLLCMRQFPSKEKLTKHNQISDLHKQNLDNWRKSRGDSSSSRANSQQYRDRAKERRLKYGEVIEPKPNMLKEKYLKAIEEVESGPMPERNIGSDNIGNKMLQKMGWKEGLGLGKSNQGRTAIVEADHRGSQAGLGSKTTVRGPNEHYRDVAKRSMFQRYHDE